MCYHVSIPKRTELDDLFDHAVTTDEWETYYNHLSGFSFSEVPVITAQQPGKLQFMNWGLIPSWIKTEEQAKQSRMNCLNARGETIFEKPSFRNSINQKRCLMPINGFYEWREVNKKKYPYYIYLKQKTAFCLAGIYDEWVYKETGEIVKTISVITTGANPLMAKIHNVKLRMPLILDKQNMKEWLKPNLNRKEITNLMLPFDEQKMKAHTISKQITRANSNEANVNAPFDYPELTLLDAFE